MSKAAQRLKDWEVLHDAGQLLIDLGQNTLGRQVLIAADDAYVGRIDRTSQPKVVTADGKPLHPSNAPQGEED